MALRQKIPDRSPVELNPLCSWTAEETRAPRHALPMHELDPGATGESFSH